MEEEEDTLPPLTEEEYWRFKKLGWIPPLVYEIATSDKLEPLSKCNQRIEYAKR